MSAEYENIINFIKELEQLKDITRTSWTKSGRRESVAEHSWRLAMFGLILEDHIEGVDFSKVIKLSLIHDLGEAYEGDIPAILENDQESKLRREENCLNKLMVSLSEKKKMELINLWNEYNCGITLEAKLVKALDKIETIIQHNQGANPEDFNYEFNLEYGKKYSTFNTFVGSIRELVDIETKSKIDKKG